MDFLDAFTTGLGLLYIILEYRASIALWLVGIIMPALDVWLYFSHGLYGDAAMAVYYTLAAVYGWLVWKYGSKWLAFGKKTETSANQISHLPLKKYVPIAVFFFVAWFAVYYVLSNFTDSTVPVLDAFTNALSFVGLWTLAHKYIEQWFFWIVVDLVATYLYIIKGIPFKAGLYGLYVVIAVFGYFKWKKMMLGQTAK